MKKLIIFSVFFCFLSSIKSFSRNDNPPSSFAIPTNQLQLEAIKHFDGIYLGVNGGSQNIFGGSFVDGIDVLAQEARFVLDFHTGYRKQFLDERFLVGLELQYGFTDGNLNHSNPSVPLNIDYKNKTQRGFGLTAGVTLGAQKRFLIFAYGNETKRNFDVTINDHNGTYRQKDKQGMLKYGIGLEFQLIKHWNLRTTFGGLRVDFGDLITNIDVEDLPDFTFGFLYQF